MRSVPHSFPCLPVRDSQKGISAREMRPWNRYCQRKSARELRDYSAGFNNRCLSPGEREGKAPPRRRVYLSEVRKAKRLAGEAGKQWRKEQLKVRGRIEAKFSKQMNQHGLRRARYWGLAKVTVQVLLNVITVNLKRAVKLMRARAAPALALATGAVSG